MTATIYHDEDADPTVLQGQTVAVVGYGNQGRSWALNLRDSGIDVRVHVRADETQDQARRDGFEAGPIEEAGDADIVCILVPDDVIPNLPIEFEPDALAIVASGYTVAFDRFHPGCDVGLVAPRMLGPEVRECYLEDTGFITAVGVHEDRTGTAHQRVLGVAQAIGGLKQGALALSPEQEAILDLAVEQVLSPGMRLVNQAFFRVLREQGIPMEAIQAEMSLSGEVERTHRLVRLEGYAHQFEYHSPTSQYGQLTRGSAFDDIDMAARMRPLLDDIVSGRFADEWDAEAAAGYPTLEELREKAAGEQVKEYERRLREQLGEKAIRTEVGAKADRPD